MDKRLIAGAAFLVLSSGAALAQSDMNSSASSTSTASAQDTQSGGAATSSAKSMRADGRYSRAEARVNQAEAEETRELNREELQQVASATGGTNAGAGQDQTEDTPPPQGQQGQP